MTAVVSLRNVAKSYLRGKQQVEVLHGVDLDIARGEFDTLHTWLRTNIYRHGAKFTPDELLRRATGSAMTMQPYLDYLRGKYGRLYRL